MFTHPSFRVATEDLGMNYSGTGNPKLHMLMTTEFNPILEVIDRLAQGIFFIELTTRFALCPDKMKFLKSAYNIIDIVGVVPVVLVLLISGIFPTFWENETTFYIMFFLSFLSICRTLRVLKFLRHHRSVRILLMTLKASIKEQVLLVMMICIGMVWFAQLIYFVEFRDDGDFDSVPIGFWWAIVTMTTVGYGDTLPRTPGGYLVGGFCALTGMLSTGLSIPVIAGNFNIFYTYARYCMRDKPPRISFVTSVKRLIGKRRSLRKRLADAALELKTNRMGGSGSQTRSVKKKVNVKTPLRSDKGKPAGLKEGTKAWIRTSNRNLTKQSEPSVSETSSVGSEGVIYATENRGSRGLPASSNTRLTKDADSHESRPSGNHTASGSPQLGKSHSINDSCIPLSGYFASSKYDDKSVQPGQRSPANLTVETNASETDGGEAGYVFVDELPSAAEGVSVSVGNTEQGIELSAFCTELVTQKRRRLVAMVADINLTKGAGGDGAGPFCYDNEAFAVLHDEPPVNMINGRCSSNNSK